MIKISPILLIIATVIFLQSCGGTTVYKDRLVTSPLVSSEGIKQLDAIDQIVQRAITDRIIPGAVVLIGHRGKVIFHRAYGHRSRLPHRLPMLLDTVFDTASLTKVVATATSILVLHYMGKLSIDDRVADYIPRFASNGKENITVRQLLTHTSGMPFSDDLREYKDGHQSAVEYVLGLPIEDTPGRRFIYSGIGYIVLAELVEVVSGMDLNEFSQKHIFIPLGMLETTFKPDSRLRERAAPTEFRRLKLKWLKGRVEDPRAELLGGISGHAGLFSTAHDLAVFCQMILNKGRLNGKRVLSEETVHQMLTPHKSIYIKGSRETPAYRGLGWDILTAYSHPRGKFFPPGSFGHTGFSGTSIWIDPFSETFVIILTNRVHPRIRGSIAKLRGRIASLAAIYVYETATQRNNKIRRDYRYRGY